MPEMEEKTAAIRDMSASGPGLTGQGTFSQSWNWKLLESNGLLLYLEHWHKPGEQATYNENDKKCVFAIRVANL